MTHYRLQSLVIPPTQTCWERFKASTLFGYLSTGLMLTAFGGCVLGSSYFLNKNDNLVNARCRACHNAAPTTATTWVRRHYPTREFHLERNERLENNRLDNQFEVYMDGVAPFAVSCPCDVHTATVTCAVHH